MRTLIATLLVLTPLFANLPYPVLAGVVPTPTLLCMTNALAARGVRFARAYCQSPICGSSRMSFYTGRYVQSHGAAWNNFPLKVGEMTLGDHLRPLGVRTALVGKTHMKGVAIEFGIHRHGGDSHLSSGSDHADCDLSAVGDQDLRKGFSRHK